MSDALRDRWRELMPEAAWPGGEQEAVAMLARELQALRVTLDAAAFSALANPDLRSSNEIQRAHDLLVSLALNKEMCEAAIDLAMLPYMKASCDVLCWCLHHDHNGAFQRNITEIEERLRSHGVEVVDMGRVIDPKL